jgi:NADH:ubiquinone oxidoreductase subunit 5 (subunit L)/multisubunit Na+/H+ antiporter MnhA subunit
MIYQGIIETGKFGGNLWIIWLTAAVAGSALTLASFMKMVHAIFLGQPSRDALSGATCQWPEPRASTALTFPIEHLEEVRTVPPPSKFFLRKGGAAILPRAEARGSCCLSTSVRPVNKGEKEAGMFMLIPIATLAVLCVLFGIFAYASPLRMFIIPSLNVDLTFPGVWNAGLTTGLLLAALLIGVLIYYLGTAAKVRETEVFVGGEKIEQFPEMRLSGTEFYNSIKDIPFLKLMYHLAGKKLFDIYEVGAKLTFGFNKILRYLHNGVLPTYLSWSLLGMAILFFIFFLVK